MDASWVFQKEIFLLAGYCEVAQYYLLMKSEGLIFAVLTWELRCRRDAFSMQLWTHILSFRFEACHDITLLLLCEKVVPHFVV